MTGGSEQAVLSPRRVELAAWERFGDAARVDPEHGRDDVQAFASVKKSPTGLKLGFVLEVRAAHVNLVEFYARIRVYGDSQGECSFLAVPTRQVATDRVGVCRAIHRGAGSRGGRAIVSRPSYRPLLCTVFPHKEVLGVKNHLSGGSRFVSTASGLPPFPRPAGRRGGASSSLRHRATPAMNPVTGGQSGLPVGLPRTLGAVFGRPHFSGVAA